MLVTFLIGLALGGFIYARVLGSKEARLSTFGLIELWVGLSALATIPLFERLPLIFVRLLHGFGDTFTVFLYFQIFLSALVMFIPTSTLGDDVSVGGTTVHAKSIPCRQRRRQFLCGQYRGSSARRLRRRFHSDPQYRCAKYDHLRRGAESLDRLLVAGERRCGCLRASLCSWASSSWFWRRSYRFKVPTLGPQCSDQRRDDLSTIATKLCRAIPCGSKR